MRWNNLAGISSGLVLDCSEEVFGENWKGSMEEQAFYDVVEP